VVTHYLPAPSLRKTYLVTLESPVSDDTAEQFAKGVQLHNEKDLTKPAVLVIAPTVRLTISEGRYHQESACLPLWGIMLWACTVSVLVRLNSTRNLRQVNTAH
jgi:16S rRNA U516 pseudouridylate synthase RsuA-like enzyme